MQAFWNKNAVLDRKKAKKPPTKAWQGQKYVLGVVKTI